MGLTLSPHYAILPYGALCALYLSEPPMSRSIPNHAATIFSEGNTIYLRLDADKGYTTELAFEATPKGLEALARLLRQREHAALMERPKAIATPSMPIQYVINAWQTSSPDAATKLARAKAKADEQRYKSKSTADKLAELDALLDATF